LFICFEGVEGCGKSTQARALYRRLLQTGSRAVLTREPGGTRVGTKIRTLLKQSLATQISPLAELFLIAAARAQLVGDVIGDSLRKGDTVVCDRYTYSTLAYQGYGRGLDPDTLRRVNEIASRGMLPDLVILLDIPVELGLDRKGSAGRDRFEREEVSFHQRVRNGYLEMAGADPQRWLVIDATLPRKTIQGKIWETVEELLGRGHRAGG
jgi:dTMP kinase